MSAPPRKLTAKQAAPKRTTPPLVKTLPRPPSQPDLKVALPGRVRGSTLIALREAHQKALSDGGPAAFSEWLEAQILAKILTR